MEFSKKTKDNLAYYVYALVDPCDQKIFYVGKASSNNRAFDHLKETKGESKKAEKIKEIRDKYKNPLKKELGKLEPIVEILRYGLKSEEAAFEVEAAVIDAIGIENLTNIVRGHGIEKGRISAEEVERMYASEPIIAENISEKCMLFFVNNSYSPTQTLSNLYDCTRGFWSGVSESKRNEKRIALSIYDGVILEVFSIEAWFAAGTTLSSRLMDDYTNRFEFVGNVMHNHPYKGKRLIKENGEKYPANQQGYGYIN